ncbi:hypothetical protein SAMN05443637_106225 [Pseudonocardia thermophila]|jgi:hypothetical protein|uniref:Tetratricopeptide repeat-containing protein n=1 Tax=Pseudonocardia thermophila TaxID=1848 RepID=A0A1M6SM87_PSETH|nr:hypothetical protein [Pseudonocardia thermophila]SHK45832.1 hypothetical protein SAMN05443637_106225 [Pseudonocardia thermophila]
MDETARDQTAQHPAPARPQPVGMFALPAGYLLVPAGGPEVAAAREQLLAGCTPVRWPEALAAHERALAGDREGALSALGTAGDPVTRYNRFVLDPDGEPDLAGLRTELGEFAVLVDLVQFALGRSDDPPSADGLDGELAALACSAQASAAVAAGDPATAVALLDQAVEHARPVVRPLAGLMQGAAAAILRDRDEPGDNAVAVTRFEAALKLLKDADGLRVGRAEIHLGLAQTLHEQAEQHPEVLAKAVPQYHSALQLVRREDAPLTWAAAHAGVATAYLTMPMVEASSQLRLGIAAQSLRQALTVYTREEHPAEWASLQLNLANSLVYAPSKHREQNLVDAAEIYEAVLATRDRATDPVGRARVLANQGNVLAHLGMFDQAKAKLYEARFLFEEHGDEESVRAVRGVLDEIARQVALARTAD